MSSRRKHDVSFQTWNLYLGADLTPLIGATMAQIPQRVTEVFQQFLATDITTRVKAIARGIAKEKPDFIGLQEAELLQLVIPTFGIVTYDFIELLIGELENLGLKYRIGAKNDNLSVGLPDSNGNLVKYLDRDAILIRKDSEFKILSKHEANFQTNLTLPVGGQAITVLRGWSSIEVKKGGKVFKLINTHLEPNDEAVRNAQATEILQGPANTQLPVIISGDMNAVPNSTTYNLFVNAGLNDIWNFFGIGQGFTGHQAPNLLNSVSLLNERVDYIFYKNGWNPITAHLIGNSQSDRTKTGLWPSDHAGLFSRLSLKYNHDNH